MLPLRVVLRKDMSSKLKTSELAQIEVSDLRVENEKLRRDLNRAQTETDQLKKSSKSNEAHIQKELRMEKERNHKLESELNDAKHQVKHYKEMAIAANEKLKNKSLSLGSRINALDSELKRSELEKSLLGEEVRELRTLLSRSEGVLETINNGKENKGVCIENTSRSHSRNIQISMDHSEPLFQQTQGKQFYSKRIDDQASADGVLETCAEYKAHNLVIDQNIPQHEIGYSKSKTGRDAPQFDHLRKLLKGDYDRFHPTKSIKINSNAGEIGINHTDVEEVPKEHCCRDKSTEQDSELTNTLDFADRKFSHIETMIDKPQNDETTILGTQESSMKRDTFADDTKQSTEGGNLDIGIEHDNIDHFPLEIGQYDDLEETCYASSDFEAESISSE